MQKTCYDPHVLTCITSTTEILRCNTCQKNSKNILTSIWHVTSKKGIIQFFLHVMPFVGTGAQDSRRRLTWRIERRVLYVRHHQVFFRCCLDKQHGFCKEKTYGGECMVHYFRYLGLIGQQQNQSSFSFIGLPSFPPPLLYYRDR